MQSNTTPSRKFSIIPDRFKEAVKSVFGRSKETKAAVERREQEISVVGDTFNTSMAAAFARQINHNIRSSYRRNTRGLPLGLGIHQLCAAKRIKNALSCTPELAQFIGETRLRNAETVLEQVKANAHMRAKVGKHRGTRMQRRATPRRGELTLKEFCAAHTKRLKENKRTGRVGYVRPVVTEAQA